MRADILRARAIMDDLAMPARPNLCFIFASASELGTAKVLAELLPPSIVVFGAVSQRGVIGTTARGSVLEEDKPPDEPLMSVTLVHLPPDTSIHPFFQPRADPHGQSAPMLGALPVSELSGSAGPARDTTLLLLADTADSVSRLMKVVGTPHVRVLGGLTERGDDAASSGSLLLRAPHAGLRAGLQRVDGAIGLYVQGGHACVPAITRGAALLPGQDWTVAVADSTPRSICPGHQVSHHVVRRLAADGSTAHDGTVSPLQALHRLSEEQGGQLPSPLFLALSATPSERRRRLVSPMHVLYQHDGALQVESAVLVGEHCRFASVTPQGSRAELAACVEAARPRFNTDGPMLCLSFVCCGRGAPFHGAPNCETLALRDAFPHMAVAGFFAMGELGPRPFFESGSDREDDATLQGFTAVHAVLQFRAAAVR
jgi:small ligand-binding sensory domain FIST